LQKKAIYIDTLGLFINLKNKLLELFQDFSRISFMTLEKLTVDED